MSMYTIEQLKAMQFYYQGKVMAFDEAGSALGQGAADDADKARVINKMISRKDSKFKIHGDKKKGHDQKVIEAVFTEIGIEDRIEVLSEVAVVKSEQERAGKAESKGDTVHAVKTLTLVDYIHADALEHYLTEKGIRYQRLMDGEGNQVFVMQNISDGDINKINGLLGRIELGEKADAVFKASVKGISTGTKATVQVAGKAIEGATNVVTSTGVQLGKSLVDIGAGAYVNAKKEVIKQTQAASMNPEILETTLAIKRGITSLKAKLGFGGAKERGGWS